jgi:hypothetical protein
MEILCQFFEKGGKSKVIQSIVECIPNKNPKISSNSIHLVIDMLANFGPAQLEYLKPFFSEIEQLTESSTANIR